MTPAERNQWGRFYAVEVLGPRNWKVLERTAGGLEVVAQQLPKEHAIDMACYLFFLSENRLDLYARARGNRQ